LALLELAIVEHQLEHWPQAQATLSELLELRRKHSAPTDRSEADLWHLLGRVQLEQGRLDEAQKALEASAVIYLALPRELRHHLAGVLQTQARLRERRGDRAGALALARQAFELKRASLGAEHPSLAVSLAMLAGVSWRAGEIRDGEIAYRQALRMLSEQRWADHPDKARSAIGLGELLGETGRVREALPYLEDGLRIYRLTLPSGHSEISLAASHLGACYAALGDERARGLLEKAYPALLARLGPDHPATRQAQDRLRRLTAS
jgi:tetratricopeptide (TPR) repeat protein